MAAMAAADFFYLVVGIVVGVLSGIIGIGGGILIVPALVLFMKMSQHRAQGTSLASLLLPIGLFAAWKYYQAGNVDVRAAALIAFGFAAGGYFGGMWAQRIDDLLLRKIFAAILMLVAVRMFFQK